MPEDMHASSQIIGLNLKAGTGGICTNGLIRFDSIFIGMIGAVAGIRTRVTSLAS